MTIVPIGARLAVISPHLDDAVLGCGDFLAEHPGSTVVTAFAGRPAAYPGLTSWDVRAGFAAGADVVAARRIEDREALRVLGAWPHWLDFPDPQYGEKPSAETLSTAMAAALDVIAADRVVVPLGLFHDDHRLASDAALALLRRAGATWLAYADAIYRAVPGQVTDRLRSLRSRGLAVEAADVRSRPASTSKRRAVACYASQLRALDVSWEGGHVDAYRPEQFWQIRSRECA